MSTDVYHTIDELNIIFQKMILDMLGLAVGSPKDYDTPSYFVRVSWPTVGAPAWKATEDICFLRVTEDDDLINRQRETVVTRIDDLTLNEATKYTTVIALNMIFYGPNSWDNAQAVRDKVFQDEFRFPLNTEKIYPLTEIVSPNRVPEAFQSKYFERVDLEIDFNAGILKNRTINSIGSAEVLVYNEDRLVSDTVITEE
jgi:hypothetical protein